MKLVKRCEKLQQCVKSCKSCGGIEDFTKWPPNAKNVRYVHVRSLLCLKQLAALDIL